VARPRVSRRTGEYMLDRSSYLIELLTPRQSAPDLDARLAVFRERYRRILDEGAVVSVPDNPLGNLHFTAMETIEFLGLPLDPERTVLHLNTFHRKADLDAFLDAARDAALSHLLVVSGDGGPRLPKLEPADLGADAKVVTSVELLAYIERRHPGAFTCGVAFNQYEPAHHEQEKLRRKIDAGARFVVTQPVIGSDPAVSPLRSLGLPVWAGAWMSKRTDLLAECVGSDRLGAEGYDPAANLAALHDRFPSFGFYLAQLSFKKDWSALLTRIPSTHQIG
jgi:methylenetetrahydrofolate reductase (NADPH)